MSAATAGRYIVVSLVVSAVFVIGLNIYLRRSFTSAREEALARPGPVEDLKQGGGLARLAAASTVASNFAADIGAGHFAEAYGLLATPYRNTTSLDQFAKACQASPFLKGARGLTLRQLRETSAGAASGPLAAETPGGALDRAATSGPVAVQGTGLLDSSAGPVPAQLVFLQESGQPRILVLSLAGVPVLQGIAASR